VIRSFAYVIRLALTGAAVALIRAARRNRAFARRLRPVLAVVSGIAVFSFAVWDWGRATPFGDFNKAYYPAGRLVFTDPARLYECGGDPGNLCFVNIPMIPLAVYVGQGLVVPLRMPWTGAMFLAGLLISLPVVLPRPGNPLLVELITRVLLSHYVFGATATLAIRMLSLKRTGGPTDDSRPSLRAAFACPVCVLHRPISVVSELSAPSRVCSRPGRCVH
jgi:hypothetical protein